MSILRIVLLFLLALSQNIVFFKNSRALSQNSNSKIILKQGNAFYCEKKDDNESTIFFRSDLGNVPFIHFKDKHHLDWYNKFKHQYTPLERCKQIANRISKFDKTSIISNLSVKETITKEEGITVKVKAIYAKEQLLYTLMPKEYENSEEILNEKIKGIFSLSKEYIEPIKN